MIYDVRGAFVAARPDAPPDLMQSIQYRVSNAIDRTVRDRVLTRVVLTIRLLSVNRDAFLIGQKASVRVEVKAAAVGTGEVIAKARFTATVLGLETSSVDRDLADGIAERVMSEFQLGGGEPSSTLATALFPQRD